MHAWPLLVFGAVSLAAFAACANLPPAGTPAEPLAPPLRVLILGDSISIGYTAEVRARLGERAVVVRPMAADGKRAENCQGTNHGVQAVDRWLALDDGGWDVIHFNFGLHDLKRVKADTGKNSNDPADPHQASPERYERQLGEILAKLQATGARLVFATTTPVPEGELRPHRAPEDAVRYNQIALGLMAEAGVAVNDLHGFALPRLAEIQKSANVHFTADGSAALGAQVARAIERAAGW